MTNELVVGWREPSDEDERTEFSIVSSLILIK